MKTRTALRLVLLVCLLLAIVMPACADVRLPSGMVEIESQAFMDSAWLRGACTIPNGVTTIGAQAFYNCSGLTTLNIPDSVTYIGSRAFYGCTGLTGTITLPEGAEVAEDAFDNCPGLTVVSNKIEAIDPATLFTWTTSNGKVTITDYLGDKTITSVSVPAQINGLPVTAIGSYAFSSSRYLTSISLPHTLTTIANHAFSYCSKLQELSMPASVTEIGRYAFYYCASLQGTLQLIDADIPSNAFTGCKGLTVLNYTACADGTLSLSRVYGSASSVKVPASCDGKLVTAIGREAFSMRTTLKTVELPKTITSIGQSAFYYCSALQYIILPENVTSIGASAFYNCTALESVQLPAGVTSIGSMAFFNCQNLYDTLYFVDATVSSTAFSDCGDVEVWCFTSKTDGSLQLYSVRSTRTEINVPASINGRKVTSMAPQAFYYCTAMTDAALPETITAISTEAFLECDTLQAISLPSGVTTIGYRAFSGCTALNSIVLPAATTLVDAQAFYGCTSLTSLTVQSNSTKLSSYAFSNCTSLSSVNLPSGFTNVGNMAFNATPWMRSKIKAIALDLASDCSSSYEKALVLHDWLVGKTSYDESYTYYGPEGVLFHGTGVCNAYAMTYAMLLDAVGIENKTVTGTATDKNSGVTGGHAWTLAKLNGEWYHIDTTWDDPMPNGRERHTYFCLTDAQMAADHTWNTANYPAANGTTYSTASISTVMSVDKAETEAEDDASTLTLTASSKADTQDDADDSELVKNTKNNKNDKKNKKH